MSEKCQFSQLCFEICKHIFIQLVCCKVIKTPCLTSSSACVSINCGLKHINQIFHLFILKITLYCLFMVKLITLSACSLIYKFGGNGNSMPICQSLEISSQFWIFFILKEIEKAFNNFPFRPQQNDLSLISLF